MAVPRTEVADKSLSWLQEYGFVPDSDINQNDLTSRLLIITENLGFLSRGILHQILVEYAEQFNHFTPQMQERLYNLELDVIRVTIATGGGINEIPQEVKDLLPADFNQGLLVIRLPQILEGFCDYGADQHVSLTANNIDWSYVYKKFIKFLRRQIFLELNRSGLKFNRLNQAGDHIQGSYHLVYSVS